MIVNLVHKLNEDPAHINMVNETVLFLSQIKTKQRYVWTKREFTEEGRALGELVDQVSLLTVQMSGTRWFFQLCVFICVHWRCGLSCPPRHFHQFVVFFYPLPILFLLGHQFPPLGSLKFNFSLPVLSDDRLPMNWARWWISTMC